MVCKVWVDMDSEAELRKGINILGRTLTVGWGSGRIWVKVKTRGIFPFRDTPFVFTCTGDHLIDTQITLTVRSRDITDRVVISFSQIHLSPLSLLKTNHLLDPVPPLPDLLEFPLS